VLVDWASIALQHAEIMDAASALNEGLALADQLGYVPYRFAQLFAACAQLAFMTGDASHAARLHGAAEVLRSLSRTAVPPERRDAEQAMLNGLAEELGAAALVHLLTLGRALPHADAVFSAQQFCRDIIADARALRVGPSKT
jgi:pyruvate-formate lyase